jgi:hypothetical protein
MGGAILTLVAVASALGAAQGDPEPPNAELIPPRFQGWWASGQVDCAVIDRQVIVGPQFITFRVDHDGFETQRMAISADADNVVVLQGRTVDFGGRSLAPQQEPVITLEVSPTNPPTLTVSYEGGATSTMVLCRR